MAYIPYSPEIGCKYFLTGPNGTIATFNDSADTNYVGAITDISGLDSAGVRENGDSLVQADGGWHGNFYYDRRPITISGTVYGHVDALARTTKIDRMRQASNAMIADATLSWTNTAAGSVPMFTTVRRQQPLKISGGWNKDFQMLLVSQFAPLFSVAVAVQGNTNLITNPSFETNTTGWGTTASTRIATGAALTRVTTQHSQATASMQVTTTATANEGADYTTLAVTAGTTYTISVDVRGSASGENVQVIVGDGTVGTANASIVATTAFQTISFQFTATATGTTGIAVRNTAASVVTFFVDAVSVTVGRQAQTYFDVNGNVVVENRGDYPAYPIITISGSNTSGVVTNSTTGLKVQMAAGYNIASGHSVAIDVLNHTATLDGVTNVSGNIDFVNSSWPPIVKGNNTFALTGGGSMSLSWRDAWT